MKLTFWLSLVFIWAGAKLFSRVILGVFWKLCSTGENFWFLLLEIRIGGQKPVNDIFFLVRMFFVIASDG